LNLGSKSLLGQLVGVVASQLRQLWEAGQANYAARDRKQASDDALDSIGELTGSPRDPATQSVALMTVTLAAGTYGVGTLTVYRTGDTTVVFANESSITTAGATLTGQRFLCTQTGPISAPAGTLINIASPYTGFSAPTNPTDAVLGEDVEEDPAFRQRQEDELQKGSASVDAVRSALLENDNVTFATVLENEGDVTDGNGLPPHSIAPIVEGGTDAEVAAIVFTKKAGGIPSYGDTIVVVNDVQGNPHNIGITRPDLIPLNFRLTYSWLSSAYVNTAAVEAAVEAAVAAAFTATQKVGRDLITSVYVGAMNPGGVDTSGIAGIVDAQVEWTFDFVSYFTTNAPITSFERATLGTFQHIPTMVTAAP
jgi:uncharacterized phage protein gp47/JayE